jgi:hypothetical protein
MTTRAKAKIEVVLDVKRPMKSRIKYLTNEEGLAFNNLYVTNEGAKKLGNPDKLKITITAAE